jgi:hypothetical protein
MGTLRGQWISCAYSTPSRATTKELELDVVRYRCFPYNIPLLFLKTTVIMVDVWPNLLLHSRPSWQRASGVYGASRP